MTENRHIQNSTTTRRNIRILDKVTTTNATPTVAYSIPLGQGRATYVRATANVVKSDFSASAGIVAEASFRRATGGNIVRATGVGNLGKVILRLVSDFGGGDPTMDLIANTGTQSIDVTVTGKSSTTIYWYIEILSLQNLD